MPLGLAVVDPFLALAADKSLVGNAPETPVGSEENQLLLVPDLECS